MRWLLGRRLGFLAVVTVILVGVSPADEPKEEGRPENASKLTMSPAVACRDVVGFEDYEPLPDAALTSEEKLIVYYRPSGFEWTRDGRGYKAHLIQDGRIRQRGSKTVLLKKDKLIDYEPKNAQPGGLTYIKCVISLKGLKPGEYNFDIILHDEVGKGAPATQTLKFKVVPVEETKGKSEGDQR